METSEWNAMEVMECMQEFTMNDLEYDHQNVSGCLGMNERWDHWKRVQDSERHLLNLDALILAGVRTYCWV